MFEDFVSEIDFPFTMLPTKVWDVGLTTSELAVLTRIIFRAGIKGQCFESRASIAEACSLTERTVGTVFAELERLQVVTIVRRRAEMKPNLIKINAPAQWISKRKIFPKEDHPQETISQPLRKSFPDPQETISYGTRSNELDQIKLDSIKELAAAQRAASQEPLVEVLDQLKEPKEPKQKTAGSQIFEAYKDAYVQRYKIEPLRNAKTYSICSQIAKQLPLDEALALVHFYVQQNVSYYLQRSHPIQLALGDLQALRTNMLKNKAMSSREAYLADKQQAQKNVLDEYLENREQIQQMFKL